MTISTKHVPYIVFALPIVLLSSIVFAEESVLTLQLDVTDAGTLKINPGTNPNLKVSVSDANLGVGTTVPKYKFTVQGDSGFFGPIFIGNREVIDFEGNWVGPKIPAAKIEAAISTQAGATGAAGAQGPEGPQGLRGPAGQDGVPGPAGPTGPRGPPGKDSTPTIGTQGLQGEPGQRGIQGLTGSSGPQGQPGKPGSDGKDGATGQTGPKGDQGPQGPSGKPGLQGPKGDRGQPGKPGSDGKDGATGQTGPKGATGARGQKGDEGDKGDKGDRGATGPKGDTGPVGPTGSQGFPGTSLWSEQSGTASSGGIINTAANVGIGTTKPEQALHVAGTIKAVNFIDANNKQIGGGAFSEVKGNAIKTSGNVGIGTTNPDAALTVVGMVKLKSESGKDKFSASVEVEDNLGDRTMTFKNPSRLASGGWAFRSASAVVPGGDKIVMKIGNDGNVGIGTTSPERRLQVIGSGAFHNADTDFDADIALAGNPRLIATNNFVTSGPAISVVANGANPNPAAITGFKTRSTSNSYDANTQVAADDSTLWITGYGSDSSKFVNNARIRFAIDKKPGTNDMPGRIVFDTTPDESNGLIERMRIDSSGNVGIGTSTPSELLEVDGKIKIPQGLVNPPCIGSWTAIVDLHEKVIGYYWGCK